MSHPVRGMPNGCVCITPASRKLSLVAIRSMKKHPSALLGLLWDSGRRHHSFTRRGRLDNAQRQLAAQRELLGQLALRVISVRNTHVAVALIVDMYIEGHIKGFLQSAGGITANTAIVANRATTTGAIPHSYGQLS